MEVGALAARMTVGRPDVLQLRRSIYNIHLLPITICSSKMVRYQCSLHHWICQLREIAKVIAVAGHWHWLWVLDLRLRASRPMHRLSHHLLRMTITTRNSMTTHGAPGKWGFFVWLLWSGSSLTSSFSLMLVVYEGYYKAGPSIYR